MPLQDTETHKWNKLKKDIKNGEYILNRNTL